MLKTYNAKAICVPERTNHFSSLTVSFSRRVRFEALKRWRHPLAAPSTDALLSGIRWWAKRRIRTPPILG